MKRFIKNVLKFILPVFIFSLNKMKEIRNPLRLKNTRTPVSPLNNNQNRFLKKSLSGKSEKTPKWDRITKEIDMALKPSKPLI